MNIWESLFLSRWGGYLVMGLLLGSVILFLRFLFGPRGLFRDARWDESNQEIRAEEAAIREAHQKAWREASIPKVGSELEPGSVTTQPHEASIIMDWKEHREQFLNFTRPYTPGSENGPVRLKVEHSFHVFDHVQILVASQQNSPIFDADLGRAALLAGLYHDCGRFPQYRQFHTFMDAQSMDHARWGLRVIREQSFLRGENDRVRHLAEIAVLLHNRYALPVRLHPAVRLITDMVRDADKLDILRIMVQHLDGALPEKDTLFLSVHDDPEAWTPKVLEDVLAGRIAHYTDLRYVNDFRLLLGTWLHELRFDATRLALARSGLMNTVLAGLPCNDKIQQAVTLLRGLLPQGPSE